MGFPKIRGTFSVCPNNTAYRSLGSILGSPYFGTLPYKSLGSRGLGLQVKDLNNDQYCSYRFLVESWYGVPRANFNMMLLAMSGPTGVLFGEVLWGSSPQTLHPEP